MMSFPRLIIQIPILMLIKSELLLQLGDGHSLIRVMAKSVHLWAVLIF